MNIFTRPFIGIHTALIRGFVDYFIRRFVLISAHAVVVSGVAVGATGGCTAGLAQGQINI